MVIAHRPSFLSSGSSPFACSSLELRSALLPLDIVLFMLPHSIMAGAASAEGDGGMSAELQTMPLSSFQDFLVDRVLSEGARTKIVTILGR